MTTDIKNLLKRVYEKSLYEEDILSTGAQVAFYFTFALFPLLLFLISLFGIILESADEFRAEIFNYLRQIMPYSAYNLVQTTLQEVTEESSGGKLTIGLLIALWSASAGVDSLRVALNSVFNLKEERSWWKTKILAIVQTLSLTLLIMLALSIVFYGSKLISWLFSILNFPVESQIFLVSLQGITVLAVLIVIFAIMYNFMPNYKPLKWHWVTPGAVVGIVLWLLLSYAFRLYLEYFNTYARTYGSLGAVIILMLWLYLTALVIIIGGIINAALQEMTDPETAKRSKKKAAEKLKRQEAALPADEIDEMIKEREKEAREIENDDDQEKNKTGAEENSSGVNTRGTEKAVLVQTSSDDRGLENKTGKAVVGLTVAGAFGFLMGLIFRKKGE